MSPPPLPSGLSLAAPAYNEGESIARVVSGWLQYLRSQNLDSFEIVITNDGSRDRTGAILDELAREAPELRVIHLERNLGAAAALAPAIQATRKDLVMLIDSDGQFPVENFEALQKALAADSADAAHGVRGRKIDSLFSRFGSWSSGRLSNWILGTHYRDFNCTCKLMKGGLARSLRLEAKGLNYSPDVMANLITRRVKIVEVSIQHRPRAGGKSSVRALRDALHRFLFVSYLGVRQFLMHAEILERPQWP